jgi:catechol 2,3-dioxygenase-like lactoylglutathione lyase family enzyme
MISYITLGSNDLPRAEAFFDQLLADFGAAKLRHSERMIFWAAPGGGVALAVASPHDGGAATVGNGVMVALTAETPAQVDRLHALALALGATDEGAPGRRASGFYCGYFRDPDGNKFNLFCPGAA